MNEREMLVACQVTVTGHVQGVGFRYFTRSHARRLNVTGWVRNRTDKAVEVYAEGRRAQLDQFLDQFRGGPPGSVVEQIDVRWSIPQNQHNTFEIQY